MLFLCLQARDLARDELRSLRASFGEPDRCDQSHAADGRQTKIGRKTCEVRTPFSVPFFSIHSNLFHFTSENLSVFSIVFQSPRNGARL